MARFSRVWRIALVAAFLLVQASALAHPIWHVGAAQAAQAGLSSSDPGELPAQRDGRLCDYHAALGAVLGALSGSLATAQPVKPIQSAQVCDGARAVSLSAPAPSSRGPPSFP